MFIRRTTHTDKKNNNERSRSVGAEHVVYETIKSLGLTDLLMALGLNKPALDAAIGVIAARLIAPSSERATPLWLQDMTALDELLDADFTDLSQDRVYKTSDLLLRHKKQIEDHLRSKECSLFNLEEKIILYDLTNTFFEGSGRYNGKAHFGLSMRSPSIAIPRTKRTRKRGSETSLKAVLRKNSTRSAMPFPRSMEPRSTTKSSGRSDDSKNVTSMFPATMR